MKLCSHIGAQSDNIFPEDVVGLPIKNYNHWYTGIPRTTRIRASSSWETFHSLINFFRVLLPREEYLVFLDNEMDAIDQILSDLDQWNILLYNSNSFSKKIFRYVRLLNEFTENNGHDALPPDFYSDKYNCMFDMMRINDSEIKKTYNPVKIRERKIERELKENGLLDSGATLFVNSESDNDEEHTFKNYKKNCKRVMSEHIRKIDIWKSEHPCILR